MKSFTLVTNKTLCRMEFSVVIPTKNRFEDLKETLTHLLACVPLPSEVIIIDQSEKTNKIAIERLFKNKKVTLKYLYVPWIHNLTEARDFGFKKSRFEIVLFLDDDITLGQDFFHILSDAYHNYPHIDSFSAIETSDENISLVKILGRIIFSLGPFWDNRTFAYRFHKHLSKPINTRKFSAGYMSLKRHVYDAIGFDLNLKGHVFVGDIDFSFRASQKFNLALLPSLKVLHRQPKKLLYDNQEGERKRVHSRLFFFQKNVKKTFLHYVSLYWVLTGLFISMVFRCITFRSIKPFRGFISGFHSVRPATEKYTAKLHAVAPTQMQNRMKFSVVIPTKNRIEDLKETLTHLLECTPLPAEVVIIDQSEKSNKAVVEKLFKNQKSNLKYHYVPTIRSLTEARDFGFKKTRFETILFLDDDITLGKDFFQTLFAAYEKYPHIDSFSAVETSDENVSLFKILGRVIFSIGPFWDDRTITYRFHKYFSNPVRSRKFSAGYMSVKRYVYETVGFDLNLKGHVFVDDIDFSFRASQKFNLALLPSLKVLHRQPKKLLYDSQEGERKRVHSRMFFFKKNVKKTVLNYIFLYWVLFGLFFSMSLRCLAMKSIKPFRGFFLGLKTTQ